MNQPIADRITVSQALTAYAWLETIAAIFNDALKPTDESMSGVFDKVCELKERAGRKRRKAVPRQFTPWPSSLNTNHPTF